MKITPNTTPFPNAYLDAYMAFLTGDEWKVLSYMVRRIMGFVEDDGNGHLRLKNQDRIALSQFMEGVNSSQSSHRDYGVGLRRESVLKALASLESHGLVRCIDKGDKRKRMAALYELKIDLDIETWDHLVIRSDERRQRNSRRVVKANATKAFAESE